MEANKAIVRAKSISVSFLVVGGRGGGSGGYWRKGKREWGILEDGEEGVGDIGGKNVKVVHCLFI